MNSDQINAFGVALCAPLDDQSERLVEALLDCEEPDSRWKRTCSEVRRQMTRQIQDRGFGRYSGVSVRNEFQLEKSLGVAWPVARSLMVGLVGTSFPRVWAHVSVPPGADGRGFVAISRLGRVPARRRV